MLKIKFKECVEDKIEEISQRVEQKDKNWERKENWRIGLGSPVYESLEIQKKRREWIKMKKKYERKKSRFPRTEVLEFSD